MRSEKLCLLEIESRPGHCLRSKDCLLLDNFRLNRKLICLIYYLIVKSISKRVCSKTEVACVYQK